MIHWIWLPVAFLGGLGIGLFGAYYFARLYEKIIATITKAIRW